MLGTKVSPLVEIIYPPGESNGAKPRHSVVFLMLAI